jgi:muconate cycloisomerase
MRVVRLSLHHAVVPLRKPIRHASHERATSDNLIVAATLSDGTTGYGEGVPRSYVTGETIESTFAMLDRLDTGREMGDPGSFEEAVRRIDALVLPETIADPRGMAGNAARCALELALLDAYGRAFGRPASEALTILAEGTGRVRERPKAVRYSGAITAAGPRKERVSAWKMRLYGFHQVKVKVGVTDQNDPSRLRTFRRILGQRMDIRIDANEAWHAGELMDRVRPLRDARPSALEQPVPHEEVESLAEFRPKLGVPIMLDESLCGYPDAERAIAGGLADIFNVRLSKCGGMMPSLHIMKRAHAAGLSVQLGCHPGETGILSAAGRQFASMVRGIRYLEGSYDRHVLAGNVIREDITFGYGGRARPLTGPGLAVTVDPDALARMTQAIKEIDLG